MGKTKRGKGTKIMAITDAGGAVLSISVQSASPHEVTLVERTLEDRLVEELPEKLIGDKAYDSDALDERLAAQRVELIALTAVAVLESPPRTAGSYDATNAGGK